MFPNNSTTAKITSTATNPVLATPNNDTTYEDNATPIYHLAIFLLFVSFFCILGALYIMRSRRNRGAAHREDVEKAYERVRMDERRERVAKEE